MDAGARGNVERVVVVEPLRVVGCLHMRLDRELRQVASFGGPGNAPPPAGGKYIVTSSTRIGAEANYRRRRPGC
jgi:hypothetical protein